MSDEKSGISDELVSQFLGFTGSADTNQATSYLEMSGGNLETAVSLYLEHNQGPSSGGGNAGNDLEAGSGVVAGSGMGSSDIPGFGGLGGARAGMDPFGGAAMMGGVDGVRAPDETRTEALLPSDVGHSHPSFQLMNAMMEEHQLAQSAFASSGPGGDFDARAVVNSAAAAVAAVAAAAADSTDGTTNTGAGESKIDNDDNDGTDKENGYHYDDDVDEDEDDDVEMIGGTNSSTPAPPRLADMFAPPTHLMHKAGGFQGARAVAKDSRRWLLVNLQRDSEFSCHALNRDVWRDELVENLVREGFIFWQAMDIAPEGQTYAERYTVSDYPHLAIIDPRTARLMWRKEGWTQENPVTAEVFAEIAMDFCSRNSFDRPPQAPRLRNGGGGASGSGSADISNPPVHEMSEDEQLRAAMQASLADGAGPAKNTSDDNMKVDDDDEVVVIENPDCKQLAADTSPKAEKQSTFSEELIAMIVDDEPDSGARIQFRMPDGKKKIRKFSPSDSVKVIYAFVAQTNDEARGGREFILMAGYPPNDLIVNIDSTIETCKLSGATITLKWK